MLDHPVPEAEVALVALGGDEPPCLALARLWKLALADGGFLEEWADDAHLSPARLSWLQMALERLRNEGFHEFLRSIPTARAEPMGRFLLTFPRPWLDRAAAAVAEATVDVDGDGVICEHASGWLNRAAAQRVRRAFVTSVGRTSDNHLSLGAAALVPLTVDVQAVGQAQPIVTGRITGPERGVAIKIDERWLHQVWGAGAAVIDDRLVVRIEPAEPTSETGLHALATVVEWREGKPTLHSWPARHDGGRWSLRASP